MHTAQRPLSDYVFSLLEDGHGREHIETVLQQKGHEEQFVKELVRETIKLRQSKRIAQGCK